MSVATVTQVWCDSCGAMITDYPSDSANREQTALALARDKGARRVWKGLRLMDCCVHCVPRGEVES